MTAFVKKIFLRSEKPSDGVYEYSRSDYDTTFVIPKKIMGWITIRMTHNMSTFSSKCWDGFYWFEFVNMFVALMLEFISMIQTARGGSFQDAVKIFRMMPCFGMVLLALAKSYMMVYHRPVFENLVNEVGDMWPNGRVTDEERVIIDTARKQLLFVVKGAVPSIVLSIARCGLWTLDYWISSVVSVHHWTPYIFTGYYWCNNALLISFLSPPVIESIKRLMGYENQMILHFFYWLPFDPFQAVYIDILLVIQTWQALVVIWCNLSGDLLFCAFLSHLTTQFDLLSLRIKRFIYVPIDKQLIESFPLSVYSKQYLRDEVSLSVHNYVSWENQHQKDLTDIILRHRALIRLSGDVESMFTFALLMNFINSSIIICFCGFCCIVVEKWNEIAYKSFLLTALSQTYLICWYGQKLLDSSKGVSHALYNSGWYEASKRVKSSIIIMMHRAQKEVRVTTCGFSVISLESYTKIIKTAWSYFTLLLNTYKQ